MTIMSLAPSMSLSGLEGGGCEAENQAGISVADNDCFPLNSPQAEDLMDREGYVTVSLRLDQGKYFDHMIACASGEDLTPEDYAHEMAFGFGAPREAAVQVIGNSGTDFLVTYRTYVLEFLDD